MRRLTPQPQSFRFRHYMRGNYAAFRSLHRVVSIGHVAGYIADAQLRKWGKHNATIADSSIESATIPSDRETDSPTTMLRQVDAMYMLCTCCKQPTLLPILKKFINTHIITRRAIRL